MTGVIVSILVAIIVVGINAYVWISILELTIKPLRIIDGDFYCPNHKINKELDELIYRLIDFIDSGKATAKVDYFRIYVTAKNLNVNLWNSNKWYAWLSRGEINGVSWEKRAPSFKALIAFKECLERHDKNVWVEEQIGRIDLEAVNRLSDEES